MLGEYIGAIHTQVLKRPHVVESERINFRRPGAAVAEGAASGGAKDRRGNGSARGRMSRARLGLCCCAGCAPLRLIAWLLTRVHWRELGGILRGAHPAPMVCAGLLTLTGLLLMATRARLLLRHWGIALSYRTVLALTWLGQFCNTFLPGSTGGDVVKFYRVCRLAPNSKTAGFAALVADRLVALAALVLLAGIALALGDHGVLRQLTSGVTMPGTGHLWVGGTVLTVFAVMLLTLAVVWCWRGGHLERARAWWRPVREQIVTGLRGGPFLAVALALALVVHLSSMGSYYLFAQALQIPATFGQVMVVWPVVMLVTLLPLSVNGYGLRELVLLYYFQRWHLVSNLRPGAGVQDTVIALSLLAVLNDFFWSLPGGFCLSGSVAAPPDAADPEPC